MQLVPLCCDINVNAVCSAVIDNILMNLAL